MVKDTDTLITELAKQPQPSRRLMSTSSVLLIYCIVALILTVLSYLTAPENLSISFFQIISSVIGLLAAYYAALTSISSSVPGASKFHYPLASAAYLFLWLFFDEVLLRIFDSPSLLTPGGNCVQHVLMLAVPPALVLLVFVFNRAPLKSGLTTFFAVCSAGIVANVCLRLCCGGESALHDIANHIAPCAILVAIIVVISRRFFSWEARLDKIKNQ